MLDIWHIQKSKRECRQRAVPHAYTPPIKRNEHNGKELHRDRQAESDCCHRPPAARECDERDQ